MSQITHFISSVLPRWNLFPKKSQPSLLLRLEDRLKNLFQTIVLSFLSSKDVEAYFQSHKGTTPTQENRNMAQRIIHIYRPIRNLIEVRRSKVYNNCALIPQSALKYTVRELDFSDSDITEKELEEIVRTYPRLRSLNLSNCRFINNISVLQHLKHLESLDLSYNSEGYIGLVNIAPLQHLKELRVLNLSNNHIADISPLVCLTKLKSLNLRHNKIQDISCLENQLTQLQILNLNRNNIQNISYLKHHHELIALDLSSNPIQNFSVLQNLTGLQSLHLSGTNIQDISFLQNLTELQDLNLDYTAIQIISPLQHLIKLRKLYLGSNHLQDISSLRNLTQLAKLFLWGNAIEDITPLQCLTQLRFLHLIEHNIRNIAPLQCLSELEELHLYSNNVKDVTPLQRLSKLKTLTLKANNVQDITPLRSLIQRLGSEYDGPLPQKSAHYVDMIYFVFDQLATKIALVSLVTFRYGALGGLIAGAAMGAYSYLRRRGTLNLS